MARLHVGAKPEHHTNAYFFFFNDTATTEIYTLSLHDALPISRCYSLGAGCLSRYNGFMRKTVFVVLSSIAHKPIEDRKSTRLNSSHLVISYAVFCLKKKKN